MFVRSSAVCWRESGGRTTSSRSNKSPSHFSLPLICPFPSISLPLSLSHSAPLPCPLPCSLPGVSPGCLLQSHTHTAAFSSTWNRLEPSRSVTLTNYFPPKSLPPQYPPPPPPVSRVSKKTHLQQVCSFLKFTLCLYNLTPSINPELKPEEALRRWRRSPPVTADTGVTGPRAPSLTPSPWRPGVSAAAGRRAPGGGRCAPASPP